EHALIGGLKMQFPQIRMESQFAQISMTQTSAKLEISQPKAEIAMEQPKSEISIRTEPGKLTIDQTQAWEAMDLMNITRRNEKIAQKAIQDVLAGMERIARQGQELMQIENNGNPIVA